VDADSYRKMPRLERTSEAEPGGRIGRFHVSGGTIGYQRTLRGTSGGALVGTALLAVVRPDA
jgi:hypothetical protein